jgi:hypothetical protein
MGKHFVDGLYTVHYVKIGRFGHEEPASVVVLASTEKRAVVKYLAWARKQNKRLDLYHKVTNNVNNIRVEGVTFDIE